MTNEPAMLFLIFQCESGMLELVSGEESDDDVCVPVILPDPEQKAA